MRVTKRSGAHTHTTPTKATDVLSFRSWASTAPGTWNQRPYGPTGAGPGATAMSIGASLYDIGIDYVGVSMHASRQEFRVQGA
jgi:hypothetical protein